MLHILASLLTFMLSESCRAQHESDSAVLIHVAHETWATGLQDGPCRFYGELHLPIKQRKDSF